MKHALKFLFTLPLIGTIPLSVISCSWDFEDPLEGYKLIKEDIDWSNQSLYWIDGDTFGISNDTHENIDSYRLIGIDTPEIRHGQNPVEDLQVSADEERLGQAAKAASIEWVRQHKNDGIYMVVEQTPHESFHTDRYDRGLVSLRYRGAGELDALNSETYSYDLTSYLISKGYGFVRYLSKDNDSEYFYPNSSYIDYLYDVQEVAQEKKTEIWSGYRPMRNPSEEYVNNYLETIYHKL